MFKSFTLWSREALFVIILFIFGLLILRQQFPVSGSADVIFEPIPSLGQARTALDADVIRQGGLRFNPLALYGRSSSDVSLTLFEDVTIEAQHSSTEQFVGGGTVWLGSDPSDPTSEVILSWSGSSVSGHIRRNGELYRILPDQKSTAGNHIVQQLTGYFPPEAEPVVPDLPNAEPISLADLQAGRSAEMIEIDVMILYTSGAKNQAGGELGIQNLVNSAVAQTNWTYGNSGVNHRLNLVHSQQISFNEQFDIFNDLNAIERDREVLQLREEYGADLVSVFREDAGSFCGVAYVMSPPSIQFESKAFSVVPVDCAVANLSFAHETGHSMGAQHDRDNAGSFRGSYLFSYGHRYKGVNSFRTIMAYSNGCPGRCPRIGQWSNPNVFYGGQPTGVNSQSIHSAANYLTLNSTAPLVASFRQKPATPTPTPTNTPTNTPTPTPTPTNTPTPTPTFTPTPLPTIVATIEADATARLTASDFYVDFQSETFTQTVEVKIVALNPADLPADPDEGLDTTHYQYIIEAKNVETGELIEISPGKDFTLTVFYKDGGIKRVKEKTLGVFYWNEAEQRWELAANQEFIENNRVNGDGSDLTYFAVMGEETEKVYFPIIFN